MERKIFNSDESRIKLDFNFEQDCYWHLRSACNDRRFAICSADEDGCINYSTIIFNDGILPVCTI